MAERTCTIEGCDWACRNGRSAFCESHYRQRLRAGRSCSIDGCTKAPLGRGWCSMHYARWRKHGDPVAPSRQDGDVCSRFWAKVDKNGPLPEHAPHLGPCWVWLASRNDKGYGMGMGVRQGIAHRIAWEWANGPVPEGMELDHLCRVRACVRPSHLEPVTHLENMRRGIHANKTHCPADHPYDEENTMWVRGGKARECKRCRNERSRVNRIRRLAALSV